MSGNYYSIDIWGLLIALVMVAVAAGISEAMRMGIGKTLLWSACRALLQLCAMGFIMEFVIKSNNPWLVLLLVMFMLIAAVQITLSRAKGVPKGLAGPVFLSLVITMLIMISLVTELIIRPQPWYAPQLVVPLTGMLLGNTVSALAVGLSRFFESMKERRDEVDTLLALGATAWEAARPSIVSSIRLGLLPTTASLASSGIVTVPGMMAGQIIAGGNPIDAAKYQFLILAAIAALTLLADSLIMVMAYRKCFTADDRRLNNFSYSQAINRQSDLTENGVRQVFIYHGGHRFLLFTSYASFDFAFQRSTRAEWRFPDVRMAMA